MKKLNWVCIGCGHIANEMAQAFEQKGRMFYAVYSRTKGNTEAFAKRYGIEMVYGSADEVFSDENVDIVYLATPHNRHAEHIIKAAESGKHVLCEKAITLNSDELNAAINACEENGVILAEAMTIYHMPVYDKVYNYINNNTLGRLKLIEVNLGSSKVYDMTNRFFNPELAGGAMLDIGVYALSFVRRFMELEGAKIKSFVKLAPTGVDEQEFMIIENKNGEAASVTLSLTAKLPKTGLVSFENGYVEFEGYNRSHRATIYLSEPIVLKSEPDISPLAYEIDDMETAVAGGENKMHLDLTSDVMAVMTKMRNEWGVKYPEE